MDNLNKWLNLSEVKNIEAQIAGFGGAYNRIPINPKVLLKVVSKSKFKKLLTQISPNSQTGEIVCVVDNLELLEISEDAKRTLEYLRDEIFNIPEIKWFFFRFSQYI